MTTANLIAGLQILAPYYAKQRGYTIGAEHDVIYAYPTETPLRAEDIARMVELGWTQEEQVKDGEFIAANYNPDESWAAYT